ncbi:FMRFamide receptor-like [Littorina saxatilis]|uniref:G-protein coupled receptors family 1 profile domain-containing protein n=1 Tax=Littorina saxatilis TaxID=31220 RepID=A0AAN9G8B1_9CAEN
MDGATLGSVVDLVTTTAAAILNSGNEHAGSGHEGAVHDGRGHVHMEEKRDSTMEAMLTTAQRMHWAASAVIGPIFVVLGLIGNIFSLIIWTRPHMRSSTGRYLTALAIADMGVLIWFILVDTLRSLHPELENDQAYAAFFAYLGYPVFFLFVVCSIWFMVGVTVDRFIMVCLITKAKEYCNERRANVGIFLICGLCFLINLPHFWSFEVNWERLKVGNTTEAALLKTPFQEGEAGLRYEFWIHCIFLVLVPWFTVFTLNLLIISKISKSNRRMSSKKTAESADKSRRSENQVTRLLLLVTFSFLVLIGFQCITQCFYMIMPDGFDVSIIDEAFAIAKLGVIINSSINFVLYCVSGRRFRHELYRLIGGKRLEHALFSYSDHSSGSGSGTGTSGTGTTGM